ncbi:hydrogenase maturation nickel metallochaperone HypA [Bacteroides heparinolyticus]|uniref:hydrogenase maturation nickel metallochaperone HypA n=1 Tax=Prevotella heparinolytica TaxID=28113 RepID=UPI0035A16223
MHEMSIAEGILDICLTVLRENEGQLVKSVQLQIGEMAGVEADSLHFCFDSVTRGTPAEGAKLSIQQVPLTGRCLDCDACFSIKEYVFQCPRCEGRTVVAETGRELRVLSVDIE